MGGLIWIVVIVVLTACSAFFSSTETAFSSVSRVRLKNYTSSGDKRAKRALKVVDQFDTALSALLIGNNIVNIGAATVSTLFFTMWLGDSGPGVSTAVMTVLVLVFGEVVPKSLAKQHPESVSMAVAGILLVMMKLLSPVIWVLQHIVKLFSKRNSSESQPTVTEEELKVIIEEIEDEGVLNEHESELVQSAIEFDDTTADEILTPRVDVAAIELGDDADKIRELFFTSGHSRLPVYEKNLDNIIGIINLKDFVKALLSGREVDAAALLQKVKYVPPKKRIAELLKELQRDRVHMAVVTDSYGGTLGVITMEDILEELVGEIWDESDEVKREMESIGPGLWRVSGDTNVYDLFEELDVDDSAYDGSSQSMSGWALDIFEQIPDEGDSFDFENLHVSVETVSEQRITSFLVRVLPAPSSEEKDK